MTLGADEVEILATPRPGTAVAHDEGIVVVIDTTTHAIVTTIPVGTGPQGIAIAPDGRRAYVASFDAELVNVIDLVTNTVTATTLACWSRATVTSSRRASSRTPASPRRPGGP